MSQIRILNSDELSEMETRIHQTHAMNKFSPLDIMNLIHTAKRVEKLEKGLKAVIEISKTDGNRMLDNCYIVANQALKD